MPTLFWLLILLASLILLANAKAKKSISALITTLILVAWTLTAPSQWLLILWAGLITVILVVFVGPIKKACIIRPFYKHLKAQNPHFSDTDTTAIQAGTIGWERFLFSGFLQWPQLEKTPKTELSEQERSFLDIQVQNLLENAAQEQPLNYSQVIPGAKLWQQLTDDGFFRLCLPEQYGGLNFSPSAYSTILAQIASASGGTTLAPIVAAVNGLGPAELILGYGTDEQKQVYLPKIATGELIPSFAVTSTQAGTNAAALTDTGIVCRVNIDGRKQLALRLNWQKRHIMLAPICNLLGLAIRVFDPEHLLGMGKDLGLTCVLVHPKKHPNCTQNIERPLGAAFAYGTTRGRDIVVPLSQIIGGKDQLGRGWDIIMQSHPKSRAILTPSLAAGSGQRLSRISGAYSRVRRQFGRQIGRFEGVEEVLARIGAHAYTCEALRRINAKGVDQAERPPIAAAIAKYHSSMRLQQIAFDSMSLQAGKATSTGPSNPIYENYINSPLMAAIDGPNIFTRSTQIFGQGLVRCHPYLPQEIAALGLDENEAMARFKKLAPAHMGHIFSLIARNILLGLFNGRGTQCGQAKDLKRVYQRLNRYSANFALVTELTIGLMGHNLQHHESITSRLADIVSELYVVSAIINRYQEDGAHKQDLQFVRWIYKDCFSRIESSLVHVLHDLPHRPLTWLTKLIMLPLGRRAYGPKDRLRQRVATIIQTPGPTRDRLTQPCFISHDKVADVALFDAALQAAFDAGSLHKRLKRAIKRGDLQSNQATISLQQAHSQGLISAAELETLQTAKVLHDAVVQVDEYTPD